MNYLDVFGAVRSQTGTTANDFRFTGQRQDVGARDGAGWLPKARNA
ncbi:MAG TPA: hypothetical protein VEZ14_06705 [Dehalococcoidia bacterium]|nr:hypothetical protein [Dehalococcoidia bacterium]